MGKLIDLLKECELLLRSVNEEYWAENISITIKRYSNNKNYNLINEVCSYYGGMGSFNDLYITELNGHLVNGNEKYLNRRLDDIRERIYLEIQSIKNQS